jgi:hypothetical protein
MKHNPRYYDRTVEMPIKNSPFVDGKMGSRVQPINVSEPKAKENHSRSISSKTEIREQAELYLISKKEPPETNEEILMEQHLKEKTK